jgi:hypothetical protein
MPEDHRADRNTAAPIQIRTAAFFSEMTGVGFMTK